MARHLADHRTPSNGARVMRFVAIARAQGDGLLRGVAKRPVTRSGNRRLVEFLRIARGRTA
jgi:hypothetical protein